MDNKFQQIVLECQLIVGIRGNPAEGRFEFALVPTDGAADFTRREDFVGMIGLNGLKPRFDLAVELDDTTVTALSHAFLSVVEAAIIRVESEARDMWRRRAWSELT
jgi:hypothetical protein